MVYVWVISHPISAVGTFSPESTRIDCGLVAFDRGAGGVGVGGSIVILTWCCDLSAGGR